MTDTMYRPAPVTSMVKILPSITEQAPDDKASGVQAYSGFLMDGLERA